MSVPLFGRGASGVGNPEINDSERRHADMIRFGRVTEARYTNPPAVRVMIGDEDDDDGNLVTGWLPMAGGRAKGDSDWHPLEVGEDVMVLSESGELQNGMVMPAARYSTDNPPNGDKAGLWRKTFADGGTVEYDRDTGAFTVNAKASASLQVGGSSVVVTDGAVTLTVGGVSLTINDSGVSFSGGTVTHDGKAIGKTHTHSGVTRGGAATDAPV